MTTTTTPDRKPSEMLDLWDPEDPDQISLITQVFIIHGNPGECCTAGYLALCNSPHPQELNNCQPTKIIEQLDALGISKANRERIYTLNDHPAPELEGRPRAIVRSIADYLRENGL